MCDDFAGDTDKSQFARWCANDGTPVRTGVALDQTNVRCLQKTHKIEASLTNKWASLVHKFEVIRSTLFDTGANGSLNHRDVEPYLEDSCYSNNRIGVVNGGQMKGCSDGTLRCSILNTVGNTNSDWKTELKHSTTTTDGLAMELFSFDEFYQSGGGLH